MLVRAKASCGIILRPFRLGVVLTLSWFHDELKLYRRTRSQTQTTEICQKKNDGGIVAAASTSVADKNDPFQCLALSLTNLSPTRPKHSGLGPFTSSESSFPSNPSFWKSARTGWTRRLRMREYLLLPRSPNEDGIVRAAPLRRGPGADAAL